MNKIQKVSMFFKWLFQLFFVSLPIVLILSWLKAPEEIRFFSGIIRLKAIPETYAGEIIKHTLTVYEKLGGCLLDLIPTSITLFILYSLIKLFKLYTQGKIFSLLHVIYLRNIGYGLLARQVIEPLYQFCMGFILTTNNPPHYRVAKITLDQGNIGLLLTGLLIILISWIIAEGASLHEEQTFTI